MKRLLVLCLMIILLAGFIAPTQSLAATTGVVRGGWLRLRAQPSFSAATITSYYTGTVVTILDTLTDWYHVRTPDNRTGYMYRAYVTVGGGGGTGTATVWSSNGYGVRLRSGPGTGYRVLTVYSVGTPVTILERGSYWSLIQVGSRVGYMMNQFLRSMTPWPDPWPDPYPNATVWSANGYGVRLRTGPGKQYGIIGVYSVGTPVMVIDRGPAGGWDYIQIGSRVGYMMNEFLHYYAPREVTNVTLNYDVPVVGCVMNVGVLTPPEATVSYQWYANDTLVSSGATYTVQAGDAGKYITLVVTGTGAYTGSAKATSSRPVVGNSILSSVTINNKTPLVGDVLSLGFYVSAEIPQSYLTCEWFVDANATPASTLPYFTVPVGAGLVTVKAKAAAPFSGTATDATTSVLTTSTGITIAGTLTGTPQSGSLLATCTPGTASVNYKWELIQVTDPGNLKTLQQVDGVGSPGNALAITTASAVSLPNPYDPAVDRFFIRVRIQGTGTYTSATVAPLFLDTPDFLIGDLPAFVPILAPLMLFPLN
ncbi:MAG: SH3 domain-containing protein, partial [Clostridia bacterium]|nr:SH3 domain-containing protein [Clostridia bacterium]